ncbi:MAG: hypothetical protein IJC43_08540 [Clostridia bacterium]|nr:hypothetical protein [Clostridia bacterium]
MSRTSLMHYGKLVFRSLLFFAALWMYFVSGGDLLGGGWRQQLVLGVIWVVFAVEMALRFFPSGMESMGCQKQFARNFRPTVRQTPRLIPSWRTASVVLAWGLLNGCIGHLYFKGIIDQGMLVLISLAYSVCDMICILFFCPFQTWFMKNKCCTSCRIYNWDYPMMFTPLLFLKNAYTGSLVLMALCLLVRWEYTVHRYPERFSETTNASLACVNCQEKLCFHKKQLRRFLAKNGHLVQDVAETLLVGKDAAEEAGEQI